MFSLKNAINYAMKVSYLNTSAAVDRGILSRMPNAPWGHLSISQFEDYIVWSTRGPRFVY